LDIRRACNDATVVDYLRWKRGFLPAEPMLRRLERLRSIAAGHPRTTGNLLERELDEILSWEHEFEYGGISSGRPLPPHHVEVYIRGCRMTSKWWSGAHVPVVIHHQLAVGTIYIPEHATGPPAPIGAVASQITALACGLPVATWAAIKAEQRYLAAVKADQELRSAYNSGLVALRVANQFIH
jgi:hypothetical protein